MNAPCSISAPRPTWCRSKDPSLWPGSSRSPWTRRSTPTSPSQSPRRSTTSSSRRRLRRPRRPTSRSPACPTRRAPLHGGFMTPTAGSPCRGTRHRRSTRPRSPTCPASACAPPTEVAYYVLERSFHARRRSWPPTVTASRCRDATPRPRPTRRAGGSTCCRAFPTADSSPGGHAHGVNAVEVFDADQLAYGDEITYRVRSVDAIGRRSAPRTSTPTPLRKYVRPPPPTTPPLVSASVPGDVPASGVEVRLLQIDDGDLTPAERARPAGSTSSPCAGDGDPTSAASIPTSPSSGCTTTGRP